MISQTAARLLHALGLAPDHEPPPGSAPSAAEFSSPPWTGLHPRNRRPARCDRGYASPYPTPVASPNPPAYRR